MYPAGTNVSDPETLVPQWIAGCKNIENGQGSAAANVSDRIDKKTCCHLSTLPHEKVRSEKPYASGKKQLRLCPSKMRDRA